MTKILMKFTFCLMLITLISCKKDSKNLNDLVMTDGMIVFNLDGTDWIVKDMVASYSDLTGVAGGEEITLYVSKGDTFHIYKTVALYIMDTVSISNKDYAFTSIAKTGSKIEIDEGKTPTSGIRYNTGNPDNSVTGTGKITVTSYNRMTNIISGSFSGEIFKTNYTDNTTTGWVKTTVKSGRFSNIPVIIGK